MRLVRSVVRQLPAFIDNPRFAKETGLSFSQSLSLPIYRDGKPVDRFVDGWAPDAISLIFYPILLLQFRNLDGLTGVWFLDADLTYLSSSASSLPQHFQAGISTLLNMLRAHLLHPNSKLPPFNEPAIVSSFMKLSVSTRADLLAQDPGHVSIRASTKGYSGFSRNIICSADGLHYSVEACQDVELLVAGRPIILLPGWRFGQISSLLFPVFVAALFGEGGQVAYWFFDASGNCLADRWDHLPETAKNAIRDNANLIFSELWTDLVVRPADAVSDLVSNFLALEQCIKSAVFDLVHSIDQAQPIACWALSEPIADHFGYVVQTEAGKALLQETYLYRCLALPMEVQNVEIAQTGCMTWPSPLDGHSLQADGFAILLDSACFAYRVEDRQAGLTFYTIAFGWHFRTHALYFPSSDCLVAMDSASLAEALIYCNDYKRHFLRHVMLFGAEMLRGQDRPAGPLLHTLRGEPAIHIGHHIWQDLTGIERLVAKVDRNKLPQFLVLDKRLVPEIYCPLDKIFPQLEGRVVRISESFPEIVAISYSKNRRFIKATGMIVTRHIGRMIIQVLKDSAEYRQISADILRLGENRNMTILIGLRAGNRTLTDQKAFMIELVEAIMANLPNALIVLDGYNSSPEVHYASVGDNPSAEGNFLRQEMELAQTITEHAASRGLQLINVVGRPIAESVLWASAAQFFIAPWGAALAKYRWISNTPGLVLTGRWNLEKRGDLDIYHTHHINESPAPIWFIEPRFVHDDVASDVIDPKILERCNFKIDPAMIPEQLVPLLLSRVGI